MALRSNGAPDVTDWDAAHFLTFNCRHWRPLDEADATGAIWGRLNCLRPLRLVAIVVRLFICRQFIAHSATENFIYNFKSSAPPMKLWKIYPENASKFFVKNPQNLKIFFSNFFSDFSNFGDLNAVPSSTWATAAKNWWTFRGTSCYTGTLCAKHKPSTDSVSQFLIFK